MFIESRTFMSPILCNLFNFIYTNSLYPVSWTKGIIVPVPKKGDLSDANNYRGITLTSIFSKIFSIMLDNRLGKWAESNDIIHDCQYGFRQKRSTVDLVFILSSIVNKVIKQERRKLYCSFVDFQKAFDLVYRNGIWQKLLTYGASTKIVKMLRAIYQTVESCVRSNGTYSEFFASNSGVKQGEPLSPFLFILFINDMYENIVIQDNDAFTIEDLKIFILLFADDIVLLSYNPEGLQSLLNQLHSYCVKWGISVNVEKTVVMIFKTGPRQENLQFYYNGKRLNNVSKFSYLGVTLSSNGSFYQAQKSLSEQANRAIFSLYALFNKVDFDIKDKLKLFDSMISPILFYSSEVWGFHKSPDIEKIYLKFMRNILRLNRSVSTAAVYGELGRFPLYVMRKVRIIHYWFKVTQSPDSLMSKILFGCTNDNDTNFCKTWAGNIKQLLYNLGFQYLWRNTEVNNAHISAVTQRIYDQYLQQHFGVIQASSKLDSYLLFKNDFLFEHYLACVSNSKHRHALCKLRCSDHTLAIEVGRRHGIPRKERICTKCNMNVIEDEYHFVLVCPLYRQLRLEILPKYYRRWPTKNKFIRLLTSTSIVLLNKLAKFVYIAFDLCQTIN